MDLLQMAFSFEFVNNCIEKGLTKSIPRRILADLCTADFRQQLYKQIENGEYKLSPPKVAKIPKDNGSFREIYICKPLDRIILTLLNSALDYEYGGLLSDACVSYRKGMSCANVVREIPGNMLTGYKLDLSKYFDSVPQDVLNRTLKELKLDKPIEKLLLEFYNDNRVIVDNKIVNRYKSLGQGCATASFLSNYLLRNFDNQMLQLCDFYRRYSDDMLLLGTNADDALAVAKRELGALGLAINPDKIEQITPDKEFKFLGFGIKGDTVTISLKDMARKKSEVKHALKLVDRSLPLEQRLPKAIESVKHIFFNYSDPCYGWLYIKALGVNDYARIAELDNYCKDCIRASLTGSWNYTHNVNKFPNKLLEAYGYVSLVHMAKAARIDRAFFKGEHLRCVTQHIR